MREEATKNDIEMDEIEAITVHGYGPGKYPDGFPPDTNDTHVPESAVREVLDLNARYMIRQGRDRTGSMSDLRKFVLADMPAMEDADCAWYNSRTMRWEKIPEGYACAPRAPPPSDQDMEEAYRRHAAYMMAQAKEEGDVDSDDEDNNSDGADEPAAADDRDDQEGYVASEQRGGDEEEENRDRDDGEDEYDGEGEWGSEGNWGTDPALNDIAEFEGSGSNYSADARQKKRQQEHDRRYTSKPVECDTEEDDLEDDRQFLHDISGNAGGELTTSEPVKQTSRRKFSEEEKQQVDNIACAIREVASDMGRTPIAVIEATGLLPPSYARSSNCYNVYKAWITTRPECPPGMFLMDYFMLTTRINEIIGNLKTFTAAVRPMYKKAIGGLSDEAREAKIAGWLEDIELAEKYQVADVDKRMQRAILQLKPLVNDVLQCNEICAN